MGQRDTFECDGCQTLVESGPEAHGWLAVQTLVYPRTPTAVAKRTGCFCSVSCLADWCEDQLIIEERGETELANPMSAEDDPLAAQVMGRAPGQYL